MGNTIRKLHADDISAHYNMSRGKLGSGSFAVVKKGKHRKTGELFAVKVIKKSKLTAEELSCLHDEVEILHRVSHPGVVRLHEVYESKKRLFLVLELLKGGELFDRIVKKGSFSEREAAEVMRQLAETITYLHSVGVVHRDLKPENLLLEGPDSVRVKITDFGLAKSRNGADPMSTACGTPGYVAPEVLSAKPYGSGVDLWSLGVILYILLCGFPPFYHDNTKMLYRQIKRGDYDFPDPYWSDISSEAKRVVKALLTVDPAKRMTAKGLLRDPWVAGEAPDRDIGAAYVKRLAVTQARLKLHRGVEMVIALNRFVRAASERR